MQLLSRSEVTLITLTFIGLHSSAAFAATEPEEPANKAVEEIVVTAQKKEELISNVPVSVDQLSGEDIEAFEISQPADVAKFSPGVHARPTIAHSNPLFNVRGIGFNDFTSIQNPAVAVYMNQVIVPYHTMMSFLLFDMERVEVLKGPQGTLYGRNSTGGAINFISRSPVFEQEAYGSVEYSSYDTVSVGGAFNAPISDSLAVRFAFSGIDRDDSYQKNRLEDDPTYGTLNRLFGRLSVLWEPGDDFDLQWVVHGGRDKSGPVAAEHLATLDASNPMIEPCPPVAAGDRAEGPCINAGGYFDPDNNPYHGDYSVQDVFVDNQSWGTSLEMNWYWGDFQLVSVTGYDKFDRYQPQDADASPFEFIDVLFDDTTWSASQEFRISYDKALEYSWMLGLYYSQDEVDANQRVEYSDFDPLPGSRALIANLQDSESAAVFASGDYWLTDQWKLFGGLRFTKEQKNWKGGSVLLGVASNLNEGDIDNDEVSGNIGVAHHFENGDMWYITYTRGYRSGGFPGAFTLDPNALGQFEQEDVYAYETGVKSRFVDQRLTLNSAVYYYDWRELQTIITQTIPGQLSSLALTNAGDAEIYGAELELIWNSFENLELGSGVNWMQTEIVDARSEDLENKELANAPDVTFVTWSRYTMAMENFTLVYQGDVNYTDEYFFTSDNEPVFQADSVWLLNGKVTMIIPDSGIAEELQVALWGKNLTDEEYRVNGFNQFGFSGDSFHYYSEPRTIGLSLKASL